MSKKGHLTAFEFYSDLGDDLQLFNRDLVNFVQQVDARNVVPKISYDLRA